MFMLSFIFVIICGLLEWKWNYAAFFKLLFVCLDIQLSSGGEWNHINRFNPVIFLSLSQGHEFSTSYVRVIVCFVDISGIVDQHCLSLLLIMIRIRLKAINRRGKFWCWDGVWMNDEFWWLWPLQERSAWWVYSENLALKQHLPTTFS
jgi:hypothetical protein